MIRHHPLAPTTHTTELRQLDAVNGRLARPGRPTITAGMLGVAGATTMSGHPFPLDGMGTARPAPAPMAPDCVLVGLTADGCPAFPRFYGHFADPFPTSRRSTSPDHVTELHTDALRALSERLGLQHTWGTDGALASRTGMNGA